MDHDFATILKWVAIIVIVLIAGWFILEVIDRIDDDVNSGIILWEGLF
jgi:hypothetical protein